MGKHNISVIFEDVVKDADSSFCALTPAEYADLLRRLLAEGKAAHKKNEIYAFPLLGLDLVTLNNQGGDETRKELLADNRLSLVFDSTLFTYKEAFKAYLELLRKFGEVSVSLTEEQISKINNGEADLHVTGRAEGIWTMTRKNLRQDYAAVDGAKNTYAVREGTGRLCLPVESRFNMLTQWGQFNVREGGAIAVRLSEVNELAQVMSQISKGEKAVEALYSEDGVHSRFDIYGMDPGFYENNYVPMPSVGGRPATTIRPALKI